jgi:acetylornithine/succinyldiaminopimelate/putrescine aminotransferase
MLLGVEVKLEALPAAPAPADPAVPADPMADLLTACREEGLLILRSGVNVLRIAPPLVITKKEIEEGIARLARALGRFKSDGGSK